MKRLSKLSVLVMVGMFAISPVMSPAFAAPASSENYATKTHCPDEGVDASLETNPMYKAQKESFDDKLKNIKGVDATNLTTCMDGISKLSEMIDDIANGGFALWAQEQVALFGPLLKKAMTELATAAMNQACEMTIGQYSAQAQAIYGMKDGFTAENIVGAAKSAAGNVIMSKMSGFPQVQSGFTGIDPAPRVGEFVTTTLGGK